jgi:hypothetical protein
MVVLKMGDPQVTMGFLDLSNDLDDLRYPNSAQRLIAHNVEAKSWETPQHFKKTRADKGRKNQHGRNCWSRVGLKKFVVQNPEIRPKTEASRKRLLFVWEKIHDKPRVF